MHMKYHESYSGDVLYLSFLVCSPLVSHGRPNDPQIAPCPFGSRLLGAGQEVRSALNWLFLQEAGLRGALGSDPLQQAKTKELWLRQLHAGPVHEVLCINTWLSAEGLQRRIGMERNVCVCVISKFTVVLYVTMYVTISTILNIMCFFTSPLLPRIKVDHTRLI